MFHDETIICEDDSDCRLLNALADHLAAGDEQTWKDTAHVPTGGKHGIRKVADVLRMVGVPAKAVFDMDFPSDRALDRDTVHALGGQWEDFESLWRRVDAAIRKGVKPKLLDEIGDEIVDLIQNRSGDGLP